MIVILFHYFIRSGNALVIKSQGGLQDAVREVFSKCYISLICFGIVRAEQCV